MEFVKENEVGLAFRKLRKRSTFTKVAVAFWGEGCLKELGLRSASKGSQFLCNLESGACNPSVIKQLCRIGSVKTNARLHAKTYITDRGVIIGSSNASANGLALEGTELSSWIEANLMAVDTSLVEEATSWFDGVWKDAESKKVTKPLLERAAAKWAERRRIAPRRALGKSPTLLAACEASPGAFANVALAIYGTDLSRPAKRKLKQFKVSQATSDGESVLSASSSSLWGYEDWDDFRPDMWLIDFDNRRSPRIAGYAKLTDPLICEHVSDEDSELTIAVRRTGVSLPSFEKPLRLSAREKAHIIANVEKLAPKRGSRLISLKTVVRKIGVPS